MRKRASVPVLFLSFSTLVSLDPPAVDAQPVQLSQRTTGAVLPLEWPEEEEPAEASWQSRLLSALGGAALGAGVGFFASQVETGDWDEDPDRRVDRSAWAAVGGSIGFAVGLSFPISHGGKPGPGQPRPEPGRFLILAEEMERTGVTNAHEAVRLLRPQWLIERGAHVIGESSEETIQVYLDGNHLGGISTLTHVSAPIVHSIQFLNSGQATVRWGAGHSHGAILVVSTPGLER